jgi:hypothetical protein
MLCFACFGTGPPLLAGVVLLGLLGAAAVIAWAFYRQPDDTETPDLGTETICPRCQRVNQTHARYCAHCGLRLE